MSSSKAVGLKARPGSVGRLHSPGNGGKAARAPRKTSQSEEEKGGKVVFRAVETSGGRPAMALFEAGEVYVYIPAELSAAGFELKIAGTVMITDRDGEFHLKWYPTEITHQDVACLYVAQSDSWTMVDQFVEPPEFIESQDLDSDGGGMSHIGSEQAYVGTTGGERREGEGVHYATRDGDAHVSGIVTHSARTLPSPALPSPTPSSPAPQTKAEAVNFSLSCLHSIRESVHDGSSIRSLTFFLVDGRELPTLHFHDGSTARLLQTMQRSLYLTRESDDSNLLRVKPKYDHLSEESPAPEDLAKKKGSFEIPCLISMAVSGLSKVVRQTGGVLVGDSKLLNVRPGTEDEDYMAEKLQTLASSELLEAELQAKPVAGGAGRRPAREADPEASLISDFQIITDIRGKLPPRPASVPRQSPFTPDEWEGLRDDCGRISEEKEKLFRARVFAGGLHPDLRKEAWKFLLGYLPFGASEEERMELRRKKEEQYYIMKRQWETFLPEQEKRFTRWAGHKHLINKDVLRTDRDQQEYKDIEGHRCRQLEHILLTYVMFNMDLGYVQGMSDLLAPLLVVLENEADAFWCFDGYMRMVEHHFEKSQAGMRMRLKQLRALLNVMDPDFYQFLKEKDSNNLYCCFRWLLVDFKREFSYKDIASIWEVFWTKYLSPDFALFVALAIIDMQKSCLFKQHFDFSDVIQHINSLAKVMSLGPILEHAEVLCRQFASCTSLPEDLRSLICQALPPRLDVVAETEEDVAVHSLERHLVPSAEGCQESSAQGGQESTVQGSLESSAEGSQEPEVV